MRLSGEFRSCYVCLVGKYFLPHQLKVNKKFFCSIKCLNVYRGSDEYSVQQQKYLKGRSDSRVVIICKICGRSFLVYPFWLGKRKYCSVKCRVKVMLGAGNVMYKMDIRQKHFEIMQTEANPSKTEKGRKSKLGNTYKLGKKDPAAALRMSKENNPMWNGDSSFEPYGLEFNDKLKNEIRKRDGYKCQECGLSEKKLGYTLHVHHIDYDKKNNIGKNLISLCRSCHSKTNFRRNVWQECFVGRLGASNLNKECNL